jgi:hypothetical protein
MDQVLKKKIGVLIHLANADGKFDPSEREFLNGLLKERGIENINLDTISSQNVDINAIVEKEQILYWALQLIKADGIIHTDELAFCKAMALKLKFLPAVIDEYANKNLPDFPVFKQEINPFKMFSTR